MMDFEKVSLTARLAAYMRQFADIPFARDVARQLRAREAFDQLLRDYQMNPEDLLWYAPIFEVRYKSVSETLRKSGLKQVLELASGLSLRGLAMTQDPAITYVESDLQGLTDDKASLIADLRRQYDLPVYGNLHLEAANALDRRQLEAAARHFQRDQPIAIVHEGLLQYLPGSEVKTLGQNIRDLLAEFGGVWITPDFSLAEEVKDVSEQQRRFRRIVAGATERPMYGSAFDHLDQLLAFFDDLGLHAQVRSQLDDVPGVTSLAALDIPARTWDQAKAKLRLWVLSVDRQGES